MLGYRFSGPAPRSEYMDTGGGLNFVSHSSHSLCRLWRLWRYLIRSTALLRSPPWSWQWVGDPRFSRLKISGSIAGVWGMLTIWSSCFGWSMYTPDLPLSSTCLTCRSSGCLSSAGVEPVMSRSELFDWNFDVMAVSCPEIRSLFGLTHFDVLMSSDWLSSPLCWR